MQGLFVFPVNLHSNMFLLILNATFNFVVASVFTFQYVSINTHSLQEAKKIDFGIYIPICFY